MNDIMSLTGEYNENKYTYILPKLIHIENTFSNFTTQH